MKLLYTLLLTLLSLMLVGQNCPPEGEGRNDKEKTLNKEKNRSCVISSDADIDTVKLIKLLTPNFIKDESVPYQQNRLIAVVGYVILQKWGGSESCNCHSKDKNRWDVHIELGMTSTSVGEDCMVVEVTPNYPNRDKIDWKKYIGHKVLVTGYLFSDIEHYHNAVNTNPKGHNNWRKTVLELHPVVNIIIID